MRLAWAFWLGLAMGIDPKLGLLLIINFDWFNKQVIKALLDGGGSELREGGGYNSEI